MKDRPTQPTSLPASKILYLISKLVLIGIFLFPLIGQAQKDLDKKIIICHHLPDNPEKPITLEIGLDELQEHLDHGDEIGPCFEGDLDGNILPYFDPPEIKIE